MSFNDFVYLGDNKPLLLDNISYIDTPNNLEYLITNNQNQKALVYAPEIDIYLKNSTCSHLQKAKDVGILYEARKIAFENARDVPNTKQISNKIALINIDKTTTKLLKDNGYLVINLTDDMIKAVIGSIGELSIIIDEYEIDCDIVLHNNAQITPYSGVYNINDINNILDFLKTITPKYHYHNYIDFNEHTCQLHKRRTKACTKCVDVCKTNALMIGDDNALIISQIDCNNCGDCFNVCPTGSLQNTTYINESFFEILELFADKNIILLDEKNINLINDISLEDFIPFVVPNLSMLNKTHLLYLASSVNAVIVAQENKDIDFINKIFISLFDEKRIYTLNQMLLVRQGVKTIIQTSSKNITIADNINTKLNSHELFVKRLAKIYDISKKPLSDESFYNIKIDKQKCTLCMSCVGACNLGAIFADGKSGKIYTNDSLCVGCGYCVSSCAEENTLSIMPNASVDNLWFESKVSAEDEAYACIECGKEFASTKAILKIADMMKNRFTDKDKIKTLYCCTECKAKIMMEKLAKEEII